MKVRYCKSVAAVLNRACSPMGARDVSARISPRLVFGAALLGTTALVGPIATPAAAQAVWQGATSDWFTDGNWSTGTKPTAGDTVVINQAPNVIIENQAANAANIEIGDDAAAELVIVNGGSLNSGFSQIGSSAGSNATVSVSGAGSSWTSTSSITVGNAGAGSLVISGGAVVSNTFGLVGDAAGGSG